MTPTQLFKLGFLTSCAAQGMTASQAEELASSFVHEKKAGLTDWIPGPPSLGTALTAGALPLVLGGGAIYAANQAGQVAGGTLRGKQLSEPIDVRQAQKQELIAAYRAQTARIKAELAKYQEQQADPVRATTVAKNLYY